MTYNHLNNELHSLIQTVMLKLKAIVKTVNRLLDDTIQQQSYKLQSTCVCKNTGIQPNLKKTTLLRGA